MLHELSLDANNMAISYWQVHDRCFVGEQILSDYRTRDTVM